MVLARFNCDPGKLAAAVQQFQEKKILVLGDVMLDRFVWGSVSRISPEAPVPVVEIRKETSCLGGAANVAANISRMGARPFPGGVIGNDADGEILCAAFRDLGASVGGILVDKGRATCVKTRIIAHHQQVCRTDREDRSPLAWRMQQKLVEWFRSHLDSVDAVVISDYAKGLISSPLLRKVLPMARAVKRIVCVDPKLRDLGAYMPATVITPNQAEAEQASGIKIRDDKTLARAGRKIMADTGVGHLLLTRGELGMALFEADANVIQIPTLAREVFDVTGAGDTVISTLSLALASGLSMLEAAILSNIAAGIVVGKLGTAFVTPEELLAGIRNNSSLQTF